MALSIEQRLAEEFERDSRICPSGLDVRITAEYRQQVMQQRGQPFMSKRRRMPKYVLITLIFILVCGFGYAGGKLLFFDHGKLSVSNRTEQKLEFKQEDVAKIRGSLEQVKAQLSPGETAVVYLRDYDLEVEGAPVVFGINNPVIIPLNAWKTALQQKGVVEKLPETLLGSYTLAEGMETSPFQANFGSDAYTVLDGLKAEAKKSGSEMLWHTADASDNIIATYTSVYHNAAAGDTIYLTWQIAGGDINPVIFQLSPPGVISEDVEIGGLTAHYLKNDQSLFGQSSLHQDVTWLSQTGDKSVVYHVQTDSLSMSKEQLVEAATSLVE
jgi:hypothetical protein